VVIDEDQLLDAVRVVNGAGRPVHAENVRKYLGQFSDEGGYFLGFWRSGSPARFV
jgi:hypothetical protein